MKVDFYHLTRMPLERVLPRIAERLLADGERLLVVAGGEARQSALDRLLWEYEAESFLPHARLGSGGDEEQPVLIAEDVNAANGAKNIALADGVWREEALDFARTFHFFDDDTITAARTAWRGLATRDDAERRYWKQNDAGRWEQVA